MKVICNKRNFCDQAAFCGGAVIQVIHEHTSCEPCPYDPSAKCIDIDSDIGVHETHCCIDHGCKYGDNDICPVVNGRIKQKYPCEECEEK